MVSHIGLEVLLTWRVAESPVTFVAVHAEKCGENRVPGVVNGLVIPCMSSKRYRTACVLRIIN
jgi:hypothetical protein